MKSLKQAFVIVKPYGNYHDFIQNEFISFDEAELIKKCLSLNKKANVEWKKAHAEKFKRLITKEARKRFAPFNETIIYVVKNLAQALEEYGEMVADAHTEHDASY